MIGNRLVVVARGRRGVLALTVAQAQLLRADEAIE